MQNQRSRSRRPQYSIRRYAQNAQKCCTFAHGRARRRRLSRIQSKGQFGNVPVSVPKLELRNEGTKNMPRSRRIRQVLLLIETSHAYGRGLIDGITGYAQTHGPWSIIFEERGITDPLPRWLRRWRGDGILSRTLHRADIRKLLATGLPIVELFYDNEPSLARVFSDRAAIGRLAAEHFFNRGLRNFAVFCTQRVYWADARGRAFQQALQQQAHLCRSFSFMPAPWPAAGKSRSSNDRDVIRWLRQLPKPCGVFCASDLCASRLIRICRACDMVVPDQIAVLGVDNDPVFCETSLPRLSSIDLAPRGLATRRPPCSIGSWAVERPRGAP